MTTVENAPRRRGSTSATASSIRSAGWVASSAAMISESEVELNGTSAPAQLRVQLDRVDQVAVVGERERAAVVADDRLGVLPLGGAGRRVAHVADRHVAGERAQLVLVEHLATRPSSRMRHDVPPPRRGRDPRRLLPAVLEREQREVREASDLVLGSVDPEHSALVARPVAMIVQWKPCPLAKHAAGLGQTLLA